MSSLLYIDIFNPIDRNLTFSIPLYVSGEKLQPPYHENQQVKSPRSASQINTFELPESLHPFVDQPYFFPATDTFLDQLIDPTEYSHDTIQYLNANKRAAALLHQILGTQDFQADVYDIDQQIRSNLQSTDTPEERDAIRRDASSTIAGVVVEYAAYLHIREHLPPGFQITSPHETRSIYENRYMKTAQKKETQKTTPDGLIFADYKQRKLMVSAIESTAYSDIIFATEDDTEEDIALKRAMKEKQKQRKEDQIYLHVNGTVPRQLIENRSEEWRAFLGDRLQERFGGSSDVVYDPNNYKTILAMPTGQPMPFANGNTIPVPVPIYRGVISEFSQSLLTDLDEIHWYSLGEPIPLPEKEFYPAPGTKPTIIYFPANPAEIDDKSNLLVGD